MEFDTGRAVSCYEYKFTKEVLFETTFIKRRMLRWQISVKVKNPAGVALWVIAFTIVWESLSSITVYKWPLTSLFTHTSSVTFTFNFTLDVCIVDQVVSDPSLTLLKTCSSRWETRFGNVDISNEGVSNWEAHNIYHTKFDI